MGTVPGKGPIVPRCCQAVLDLVQLTGCSTAPTLCTDLSPLWAHPSHSNKGSDCLMHQKKRTKLDSRVDLRFRKANVCSRAG